MKELLILQVISHLLTDFYLQSDESCKHKKEKGYRSGLLYLHGGITFLFSWALSLSPGFWKYALAIGVLHLVIDGIKSMVKKWKYVFFADQLIHLVVIVAAVRLYQQSGELMLPGYLPPTPYLLYASALLLCQKPTNVIIKEVLNTFEIKSADTVEKSEELDKAGRIIGNLERILTLVFVLVNQFGAIGFLFAAKSLLRFKDTARAKTEYVLVGTLLSFGMAIICGLIITKLK